MDGAWVWCVKGTWIGETGGGGGDEGRMERVGTWAAGEEERTPPWQCLTWGESPVTGQKNPHVCGRAWASWGAIPHARFMSPVCVVGLLHVWVGALGSLAAWLPFRLGMRRIPGGMTMDMERVWEYVYFIYQ